MAALNQQENDVAMLLAAQVRAGGAALACMMPCRADEGVPGGAGPPGRCSRG